MTITATVDGVTATDGVTRKTDTFDFTLLDPCDPPNDLAVATKTPDVIYTVTQGPLLVTP